MKLTRLATGEVMETPQSGVTVNETTSTLDATDLRILLTIELAWEVCAKVNVTRYPIK